MDDNELRVIVMRAMDSNQHAVVDPETGTRGKYVFPIQTPNPSASKSERAKTSFNSTQIMPQSNPRQQANKNEPRLSRVASGKDIQEDNDEEDKLHHQTERRKVDTHNDQCITSKDEALPTKTQLRQALTGIGIEEFLDVFDDDTVAPTSSRPEPITTAEAAAAMTSVSDMSKRAELAWLLICFFGIMVSFVVYGLLLEYATSGGRELDELTFLFVTSALYTAIAMIGRVVGRETPTTIPASRYALLGFTSLGSTFLSVRALRYVIFPIQVISRSCKPVPVMLIGTLLGKKYKRRKYIIVALVVFGVALFMGGGYTSKQEDSDSQDSSNSTSIRSSSSPDEQDHPSTDSSSSQIIGILMLFAALCFDGGTGAYEDKLMSVHSVQPFDMMYRVQLAKTLLAGIGVLVLGQINTLVKLIQDMGFLLFALGLSGALGQVFIFVTIAKFGALTCSIISLARKVVTVAASIYIYGHHLNGIQGTGLVISVVAMVSDFLGKQKHDNGAINGVSQSDNRGVTYVELQQYGMDDGDGPEVPHDEEQGNLELESVFESQPKNNKVPLVTGTAKDAE